MSDASGEKRRDAALDNVPGREHFIYALRFNLTGKCYIGQTLNQKLRWYAHHSHLRTGKHWCIELQADWDNHGKSAFSFVILEGGLYSKEAANAAEAKHIFKSNCYNYLIVIDENGKPTPRDLLRKVHSDAVKKAWADPTSDLRNPTRRRFDDPQQKIIQSESQKRRYSNLDERRKTSETTKAGQTLEVRNRKSIATRASWLDPNGRQRKAVRIMSPEGKLAKAMKIKAFWASSEGQELKRKKSEKIRSHWDDPNSTLRNRSPKTTS